MSQNKRTTDSNKSCLAAENLQESSKVQSNDSLNKNMKCIGILPGLAFYGDSSDSDCSSDTDDEPDSKKIKYDMLGRKIIYSNEKIESNCK